MRLDPGHYRNTSADPIDLTLKRSNSIGSRYLQPSAVAYWVIKPGETFDIPETNEEHYYTTDSEAAIVPVDRVAAG